MGRLNRALVFGIMLLSATALTAQTSGEPGGGVVRSLAIEFVGNRGFSDEEVAAVVEQELEAARGPDGSPADLIDAAYTLQMWYAGEGYPDADVQVRMIDEVAEELERIVTDVARFDEVDRIEFIVTEGDRLVLGRVEFEGNEAFSDETLRRYVPRRGTAMFGAGEALYRASEIEAVAGNVRQHYLLGGYLRVNVEPPRTSRDDGRVDVVISIDEGRQFAVGTTDVSGDEELPPEIAARIRELLPRTGQVYTERKAADSADEIERYLGRNGYLTSVRYRIVADEADATVAIEYSFTPGERAHLGSVRVEPAGDEPLRIRRSVVRNRFPLEPGERLDASRIGEGRQRLYQTGLFRVVSTDLVEPTGDAPKDDPGDGRTVDLLVTVEEDRNRYAEIAAGWSSLEMVLGSLDFVDRNVFGTGRLWGATASGSFRGYSVSTRFVDRFLLGIGGRLSFEIDHSYRARESYTNRTIGADLTADVSITDALSLAADYRFSYEVVDDLLEDPPARQTIRIGSLNTAIAYDTIDSSFLPTGGIRAEASGELAGALLGSQLSFVRVDTGLTWHASPHDLVVFSVRGETAGIIPIGAAEIPVSERLYAGGSDSVRSFPQETLSPTTDDGKPSGGLTLLEGTAEVRVRMFDATYLALFYDVGMVASRALSLAVPGHGVGLGLRYQLPIGPIRLDAAVNPGPTFAAERSWAVHFSIGAGM
ncbi:MAG: BamA/OMP85 family outer membrane protein [Spirochaetota bacterium]